MLRLKFSPPLWIAPPAPPPAPPTPPGSCMAAGYSRSRAGASVIGDQQHEMKLDIPNEGNMSSSPDDAAALCCKTAGCVAFSVNPVAKRVRHFPANFHHFDRFKLDLRGHTQP